MATEQMYAFLGSSANPTEQFVLLSDSDSTGDFMTHFYIQNAIKAGHKLCVVSLLHPFSHYASISSKLTVNLQKALEVSQVNFINCLHSNDTEQRRHIPLESPDYLQETIIHSINSLSLGNNGVPVCVLLDDLDVLLSLGWSLKTVVAMVSNVYNHLVSNGTTGSYLVVVSHDQEDIDSDNHLLYKHLLHCSTLHLKMTGLSTGYSKLVHGELHKEIRDPFGTTPLLYKTQTHSNQYRILDRGIRLFAKGTSEAVL